MSGGLADQSHELILHTCHEELENQLQHSRQTSRLRLKERANSLFNASNVVVSAFVTGIQKIESAHARSVKLVNYGGAFDFGNTRSIRTG